MSRTSVTPQVPNDPRALGAAPVQNQHGQWCTKDSHGTLTPHPSKDAAIRVATSDEAS